VEEHLSHEDPTILIVETDSATREMYRRELALAYQVFACADNVEAQQILGQHAPDVVVLEPVGCGWGLFEKLKGKTPLIVCSTCEVSETRIRKELAACLVKPVLPTELCKAVEAVLAIVRKQVTYQKG
jgi:DNA-binding response OmpR family regulator